MQSVCPIVSLNLVLSSACGADCIYCPADRGLGSPARTMPFETAKLAIDQARTPNDCIKIERMDVGENGDAFINKRALDVLRYAKSAIPGVAIHCFTNLQTLSEAEIDEIVREGLLDSIGLNVDGASNQSFKAVKGIGLEHVNKKLPIVMNAREKYGSKLTLQILVLTARHYVRTTTLALGKLPSKLGDLRILGIEDDYEQIKAGIQPYLRAGDSFGRAVPVLWAERALVDPASLNYSDFACSQFQRVLSEAFIAPDGSWYACCLDSKNRLIVGNIHTQTLSEIATGEPRRKLIESLAARKFGEIGPPCNTVNCCQAVTFQ